MSEELDFSTLKLDDISVGGQPLVAPSEAQAEPSQPETVNTPTEQVVDTVETPAETPAEQPVEKAADPVSAEYKFKDDFIKGVVDFYEKTGDISAYLQAKLTDFNQMSDEEIMRRSLKEQYPDVSEKAFERLYQQQVGDKYKLDADMYDEDDVLLGRELLKGEADKARQKYMDWQKNFSAPEPKSENTQPDTSVADAIQKFNETVKSDANTKSLLENKRIVVGGGESEFNYEVPEVESLLEMTLDNDKFFSQFALGEGKVDLNKWYKMAAYSKNPELFEKSLINHGKALGRQEVTKEIKNPSQALKGDIPTESSGDFASGLLQAFADRGVHK
jgi:hypothetical protein